MGKFVLNTHSHTVCFPSASEIQWTDNVECVQVCMWERGRNMRQCVKCRFNRFHVLMLIHQWHNFVAWMCSVNVCVVRVSVSAHELNFLCPGLLPGWCWLDAFLFPSLPLPLFCSLSFPFSFSSLDSSSIHSSFPRIPWQRPSLFIKVTHCTTSY